MDYWHWDGDTVFVCDDHLAWFNSQEQVLGQGGRSLCQPFDDYLNNGPWLADVPVPVREEVTAAVNARKGGSPLPAPSAAPHPYRPAAGNTTDWEYYGPHGVRFEGDHLLWYEQEGAVRFASGGACEQTFESFFRNGPHMSNVQGQVVAEVAAAVEARLAAGEAK